MEPKMNFEQEAAEATETKRSLESKAQSDLIARAFDDYREKVIDRDAPPIQILECKRAFFAGAFSGMQMFYQIANSYAEDLAVIKAKECFDEVDRFAKEQIKTKGN